MYNAKIHQHLKKLYTSQNLTKSLQSHVLDDFTIGFDNQEAYAAVIFIDVFDFSKKVSGKPPQYIKKYLDEYYGVTLGSIINANGKIDRIAGDGILAIFSNSFSELSNVNPPDIDQIAFKTAESIVQKFLHTNYEVKASLSFGQLLFCKTNFADIFEDYTVIGDPITIAYRLDNDAGPNEINLLYDASSLLNNLQYEDVMYDLKSLADETCSILWEHCIIINDLKGIGKKKIYCRKYRK